MSSRSAKGWNMFDECGTSLKYPPPMIATAIPPTSRQSLFRMGYAYVVADLIHVGHLNHLEACKQLCDKLVVGVLTDEATKEKKLEPAIPFEDRLRMVRALKCVDIAVSQETYSPLENACVMQVDILFESTSHSSEAIAEARRRLANHGGEVIVLPYYGGCSTTAIKKRIKQSSEVVSH